MLSYDIGFVYRRTDMVKPIYPPTTSLWGGGGGYNFDLEITLCPPSHLGAWLCEGGGHGSEAAVSGKLV
jgi:hypothetical protein